MKTTPKNIESKNSNLLEKHLIQIEQTGTYDVFELKIFNDLDKKASLKHP